MGPLHRRTRTGMERKDRKLGEPTPLAFNLNFPGMFYCSRSPGRLFGQVMGRKSQFNVMNYALSLIICFTLCVLWFLSGKWVSKMQPEPFHWSIVCHSTQNVAMSNLSPLVCHSNLTLENWVWFSKQPFSFQVMRFDVTAVAKRKKCFFFSLIHLLLRSQFKPD